MSDSSDYVPHGLGGGGVGGREVRVHIVFSEDTHWFHLCKSKTLWNNFMILNRNVEQDQMTCCVQEWRMTTLPLLLLALSPFVISDRDYPLILCLLCKSKTLWNIFMILGRNVEQDQRTCRIQEWQLCLSYLWCCLPLLCLTVIIHWFCVRSVSQRPFGIFLWYVVEI